MRVCGTRHSLGAHPRSRGDHVNSVTYCWTRAGSSPLARGPPPPSCRGGYSGLIPARAGTTIIPVFLYQCSRAHPRSRGDHRRGGLLIDRFRGSSPLARGPRALAPTPTDAKGLIPARAGTTCRGGRRSPGRRAHPRSRGDHQGAEPDDVCRPGSSPLARGPPNPFY